MNLFDQAASEVRSYYSDPRFRDALDLCSAEHKCDLSAIKSDLHNGMAEFLRCYDIKIGTLEDTLIAMSTRDKSKALLTGKTHHFVRKLVITSHDVKFEEYGSQYVHPQVLMDNAFQGVSRMKDDQHPTYFFSGLCSLLTKNEPRQIHTMAMLSRVMPALTSKFNDEVHQTGLSYRVGSSGYERAIAKIIANHAKNLDWLLKYAIYSQEKKDGLPDYAGFLKYIYSAMHVKPLLTLSGIEDLLKSNPDISAERHALNIANDYGIPWKVRFLSAGKGGIATFSTGSRDTPIRHRIDCNRPASKDALEIILQIIYLAADKTEEKDMKKAIIDTGRQFDRYVVRRLGKL